MRSRKKSHGRGTNFDTPSLRGVWLTAPYFHDGSAATIQGVFRTGRIEVGSIGYDNGTQCALHTTEVVRAQYQLQYDGQQPVVGLHIPSHRPPAVYHNVEQIPINPTTAQQHYQDFQQLLAQTYGSGGAQNPGRVQKQSIISLALFGYGNPAVQANPEFQRVFEELQAILSRILPSIAGIDFQRLLQVGNDPLQVLGPFGIIALESGLREDFHYSGQINGVCL